MIVAVVSLILGVAAVYWLLKPAQRMGKPVPGPPGWPIVGNLFQMAPTSLHTDLQESVKKYGDILQLKVLGRTMVVLNTQEMIHKAFTGDEYKFVMNDRPDIYLSRFYPQLSILLMDSGFSDVHSSLRKGFTKGLHVYGDGIKVFEETVQNEIRSLLSRIDSKMGEEFDCPLMIRSSIISLVSVFLFGEKLDPEDQRTTAIWNYIQAVNAQVNMKVKLVLTKIPLSRYIPGRHRDIHNTLSQTLNTILEEYYNKPKATYVEGSTRGFVDFMFAEQRRQQRESTNDSDVLFTDDRIKGVVGDVILAGVSTTVATLTSMILCMINHPEVQRRVQTEIHEVIGKDRLPTLEDKANCPYVEAVLLETSRYISIAPLGVAHLCKKHVSFEGFDIPANTLLLPNIWHMHHDENIWGDPWNFRPERFLDDGGQLLHRSHVLRKNWMPFGVGRRQCIGEPFARSRLFLYFTSLMQNWTFLPVPGKCGPCDPRSDQYDTRGGIFPKSFFCRAVKTETPTYD